MDNSVIHKNCSVCETRLKRQVIGSNVFYYCRNCGRVSSEACLSGGIDLLQVQKSLSVHMVSSTTDSKISEDSEEAIAGT
ncbi:hypothetical protein SDC9_138748 [bioreactor metagenome]|uniref:Uncharacterized protein n=1 Tax=bioreactor metagenome TaxID=1076179 RepID=A0A645DQL3_9ZZZZ